MFRMKIVDFIEVYISEARGPQCGGYVEYSPLGCEAL
jgi:hypothetical protein